MIDAERSPLAVCENGVGFKHWESRARSIDELEEEIAELCTHIDAATYRRASGVEDLGEARRHREERYLEMYTDEDGMVVIRGRLPIRTRDHGEYGRLLLGRGTHGFAYGRRRADEL
jgi:hypothetical protein